MHGRLQLQLSCGPFPFILQLYVPVIPGVPADYYVSPDQLGLASEVFPPDFAQHVQLVIHNAQLVGHRMWKSSQQMA
jgi:hypothetical protein